MKLIPFPSRSVLAAVSALEADLGHEVDELAASVLVVALNQGAPVPAWSLRLLLSVLLRNIGHPLAGKLALSLAPHVEDLEVLVVGLRLAQDKNPSLRAVGDLVLSKVR
jgi:hypothetical protein